MAHSVRNRRWHCHIILILTATLVGIAFCLGFTRRGSESKSDGVKLVMSATVVNKKLCISLASALEYGYHPILIKTDLAKKEPGLSMNAHMDKVHGMFDFMKDPALNANDLIVMADAYDVLFQDNSRELHKKWSNLQKENETIFIGLEKVCWPPTNTCDSAEPSRWPKDIYGNQTDQDDWRSVRPRWINSGVIIGQVKDLLPLYEFMKHFVDLVTAVQGKESWRSDQAILQGIHNERKYSTVLDFGTEMIQVHAYQSSDLHFDPTTIITENILFGTRPSVIHYNARGADDSKRVHWTIGERILDRLKGSELLQQPLITLHETGVAMSFHELCDQSMLDQTFDQIDDP